MVAGLENTAPISTQISLIAQGFPDAPAITCAGRTVTWTELDADTNRRARAFADRGVGVGDYVTIVLPNSIEFLQSAIACWKLGAVPQPLPPRMPDIEFEGILDLRPRALIVGRDDPRGQIPSLAAGFEPPQLAICSTTPFHVDISGYERFIAGRPIGLRYLRTRRPFLENRRIFLLRRAGEPTVDSRTAEALAARIELDISRADAVEGDTLRVGYAVTNTGSCEWLPSDAPVGGVQLGGHLYDEHGTLRSMDHVRAALPGDGPTPVGATVRSHLDVPVPGPGRWTVEIDVVSNRISWFEMVGATTPARIDLDVCPR